MRTLIKIFGFLLIVAVITVVVVASNLGSIIKKGVETYAPPVLGTAVTLNSAKILPLSGEGNLKGLSIAQPTGFGSGDVIALNKVALGVALPSLREDTIVVKYIIIDGPLLNYVQTASGNNIQKLLNNVQNSSASSKQSGDKPKPAKEDEKPAVGDEQEPESPSKT